MNTKLLEFTEQQIDYWQNIFNHSLGDSYMLDLSARMLNNLVKIELNLLATKLEKEAAQNNAGTGFFG